MLAYLSLFVMAASKLAQARPHSINTRGRYTTHSTRRAMSGDGSSSQPGTSCRNATESAAVLPDAFEDPELDDEVTLESCCLWDTKCDEQEPDFAILIFIHYNGMMFPGGESMQLDGTKNDLPLLLDFLGYRHRTTEQALRFYVLADFDCLYTDCEGITNFIPTLLPTKAHIAGTIIQATQGGGSGLIFYGGHCERGDNHRPSLLPWDRIPIYSNEFYSWLPRFCKPGTTMTIVLDACETEPFLVDILRWFKQDRGRQEQLVIVSAADAGQRAGTVEVGEPGLGRRHGTLTWYLTNYLRFHPSLPAPVLEACLVASCICPKTILPHPYGFQRPRIAATSPLPSPFRLL